jgi:hypothetical protein
MIGEFDLHGIFLPALLVWAVIAVGASFFLRWVMTLTGFYRLVWHRGLFDLAVIVILWAVVAAVFDPFRFVV